MRPDPTDDPAPPGTPASRNRTGGLGVPGSDGPVPGTPGSDAADIEATAERVFAALADPSRRTLLAELAQRGPATATELAERLPITRQAIAKHLALLSEAGLVVAEPGERRRVRYRLRSAPMQVAQRFLAALARDWDGPLSALVTHLNEKGEGT